jgi:hypothetical protein
MHDLPLIPPFRLKIQKRGTRVLQLKKKLKRLSGTRPFGLDDMRFDPSIPLLDNQRLCFSVLHPRDPDLREGNAKATDYKPP